MAIEELNEATNRARVNAGFKGGDLFKNPVVAPAMDISTSNRGPAEGDRKLQVGPTDQPPVIDPWMDRKAKGS